jgi:hypothetical protein
MNSNTKKYILVFLLTCGVFGISWFLSNYANRQKIEELQAIQNKVSVDILSSETQFSLLEEMSCTDLNSSVLSTEISNLAEKLNYSEQSVGNKEDIALLKKQYTILQIKDFLLSKRIGERCGKKPVSIIYFYGDDTTCKDCEREGYVLDALRQKYPSVRTYAFDYSLDLSTIKALKSIYKIDGVLPAMVIGGHTVTSFQTLDQLTLLLPKDLTNLTKGKSK